LQIDFMKYDEMVRTDPMFANERPAAAYYYNRFATCGGGEVRGEMVSTQAEDEPDNPHAVSIMLFVINQNAIDAFGQYLGHATYTDRSEPRESGDLIGLYMGDGHATVAYVTETEAKRYRARQADRDSRLLTHDELTVENIDYGIDMFDGTAYYQYSHEAPDPIMGTSIVVLAKRMQDERNPDNYGRLTMYISRTEAEGFLKEAIEDAAHQVVGRCTRTGSSSEPEPTPRVTATRLAATEPGA
jgi:hypothetical protein